MRFICVELYNNKYVIIKGLFNSWTAVTVVNENTIFIKKVSVRYLD